MPVYRFLCWLSAGLLLALTAGCGKYSDEMRERHALNKLFVHERFADLEAALQRAERSHRSGRLSSRAWEARLYSVPDLNAEGIEAAFDRWVLGSESAYAYQLRGKYLMIAAWEARGMKLWADTSPEQREVFRQLARKAEPDLMRAYTLMPACAACAADLISVALALGAESDLDAEHLLEQAIAADPKGRLAPVNYLMHLKPQWGGSYAAMENFIALMRQRLADPLVVAELESIYCWERARAAGLRGESAEELAWFERGLTARPYDHLMKNLAETYTELERHADAVRVLERNLELNDPWDIYTLEALGHAYYRVGDTGRSRAMFAKRDEAQFRYFNFL